MTAIANHSNDCYKTSSVMYFFSRHDAFYEYFINVSCISKFLNCCPRAEFSETEYLPRRCSESFQWQVWLDWNHGNILTCNSMTDWNLNDSHSVQSYSDIFCHEKFSLHIQTLLHTGLPLKIWWWHWIAVSPVRY